MNNQHRPRYAQPIPGLLKARREARKVRVGELVRITGVSRKTINRAENGEEVYVSTAEAIARALGENVESLFRVATIPELDPSLTFRLTPTEEWQVEDVLGQWITTTNGVQFCVCRMRHKHKHSAGRWGRGKFYFLLHVRGDERVDRQRLLSRHQEVADIIGVHPNVALNMSSVPTQDGNGWWIIDRWVEGETLDKRLGRGPLGEPELRSLATHSLNGLAALHIAGVVFRELAPSRVIVTPDGSAVLTDFELAKLFDGLPSVKPGSWPDDPYRAPEVASGRFDHRADLYSWARVVSRCVLGELPVVGDDSNRIAASALPKGVRDVVKACLALRPDMRPGSAQDVLQTITRWS